jgi:hypothetical protein
MGTAWARHVMRELAFKLIDSRLQYFVYSVGEHESLPRNIRGGGHEPLSLIVVSNYIQDDQKVSVHLMITIQKVTINVQSDPRQSPDIY